MKLKRLLTGIVSLALCSILTACGSSDSGDIIGDASSGQYSTRIHMLVSESGSLTRAQPESEADSPHLLTLKDLEPNVLWYTDRPERETGSTPVKDYVNTIWRNAYGDISPNATIQFKLAGTPGLEGVYVTLSSPSYDEKLNTATFQARILNDTIDAAIPDSLAFTGVTLNVLNNAVDENEVSSYIQYASQAVLQPTSDANQYKVVLSDAGPDMFWVDNAPGTYSDSRPMSYFFPQWPHTFKDNPPNAALFGTTATGDLKLYFLTLTDPAYDAALGQVTYTATLLNQTHGALETLGDAILSIDSGNFTRFPLPGKGTAYQAFGHGYDPSTANKSYIYFGSDIARKQAGALWGTQSYLPPAECNLGPDFGSNCRNDLQTMKNMGINLVRLYDWDSRNDHRQFLDYAHELGIKILAPISNWLPTHPEHWNAQVPDFFNENNFGKKNQTGNMDWHPAIAGVIISNELDRGQAGLYENLPDYENAIGLVAHFLQVADNLKFSKGVLVGVPVTFVPKGAPYGPNNAHMPGWNQFERLLNDPRTANYKDRLMLCPNTYNEKDYLFSNAEGTGKGWVPLTYEKFGAPILFTEIGLSRQQGARAQQVVKDQLQGVLKYQIDNPNQLLGAIHFQFDNKVWKQTADDSDSEGAFGAFRHGVTLQTILTNEKNYNFFPDASALDPDGKPNYGALAIDRLEPTTTYEAVVQAYK